MTSRIWILRTFVAIAVILCLNLVAAFVTDPYGLLRDPRGRQLNVVFAARKAKFLLSKRYVPENFDALLIGPSNGENWDLASVPGYKFYNESILGSNVFEMKKIVDQALPLGHFKLAVCILYPSMTNNHGMNDGLDAVTSAEAFGSIHLYVHEAVRLLLALHLPAGRLSAADGATPLKVLPRHFDEFRLPAPNYYLDPVAVGAYVQMVQSLQQRGTRIIYVIPPLYEGCRKPNEGDLAAYKQAMQHDLPAAPIIDLDGPEFEGFRTDPTDYIDCFHVSAEGAAKIDDYLAQRIPQVVAGS